MVAVDTFDDLTQPSKAELTMDFFSICWMYCQTTIRSRIKDERGASLVEYALLLALIAVICIGAITLIGSGAKDKLSEVGSKLQ